MQAANAPRSEDELSANAHPKKKTKKKTQSDGDALPIWTKETATKGGFATPRAGPLHHAVSKEVNHGLHRRVSPGGGGPQCLQHPQPITNTER